MPSRRSTREGTDPNAILYGLPFPRQYSRISRRFLRIHVLQPRNAFAKALSAQERANEPSRAGKVPEKRDAGNEQLAATPKTNDVESTGSDRLLLRRVSSRPLLVLPSHRIASPVHRDHPLFLYCKSSLAASASCCEASSASLRALFLCRFAQINAEPSEPRCLTSLPWTERVVGQASDEMYATGVPSERESARVRRNLVTPR